MTVTRTEACVASAALAALATVRDPELDEPVTTLGFVASCTVSCEGRATVRLRLPTYFCAPNFAYLMVADAFDAVSAVPGVRSAAVFLDDHFASDTINHGVAARAGFVGSFVAVRFAEAGHEVVCVDRRAEPNDVLAEQPGRIGLVETRVQRRPRGGSGRAPRRRRPPRGFRLSRGE